MLAAVGILLGGTPPASAAPGALRWSSRWGAEGFDRPSALTVDAAGNVIVAGYFNGSVSFGGPSVSSAGGDDIFVTSVSAQGQHLWSRAYGDVGLDEALGVAVDRERNVVVVGSFARSVDLGGGPLTSAGRSDAFIVKLSPQGSHLWSRRLGSSGHDEARAVAVGVDGTIVVTGRFEGTVDVGGGPLASAGSADVFIAAFSPDGSHRWSRRAGGVDFDAGNAVAIGSAGEPAVAGVFRGAADFGGGVLASAGLGDVFLASYSSDGAHRWSSRFGAAGLDEALTLTAAPGGALTIGGSFEESVDFGGGARQSAGFDDGFAARYGSNGAHQWSVRFGGAGIDIVQGVAIDQAGEVAVTGRFEGTMSVGGGSLAAAGGSDAFVIKTSAGGTPQWSKRFGADGGDGGVAVAFDQLSGVLATGWFRGAAGFGGQLLTSAGFEDVYLASLAGADPQVRLIESDGTTRVAERGVNDSYNVVLAAPPAADVTVVASDPAGQVTLEPSSLTFTGWDWFVQKRVSVRVVDDDLDEGTHGATIVHHVVSADPRYDGIGVGSVQVVILDNDEEVAPVTTFTTANGAVLVDPLLLPADRIAGTSTDERSGILSVALTFTAATGAQTTLYASLRCAGGALVCSWDAPIPSTPGVYEVRAQAQDQSLNVEDPGPTIAIVVL